MMLRLCLIAFVWYFIANLGLVLTVCPSGWRHYNSSCYFFSSQRLNWYLAEFACRGHDARLVEIETKDRQDYIADLAKRHPHSRNYWTGGRDDVTEGRWIWSSTDQPLTYTNWGPNEPTNSTGQNCIAIHAATTWQWVDGDCSKSVEFICEKKYHDSGQIVGFVLMECPLGWQHYNSSCYFFSSESLNWYLAQSACRGHEARLAEIETKDRQDYISDLAKRFHGHSYWIGGRDDIIEDRWTWSSTDQQFKYTNWGPNEPDGGTGQNCLAMYAPYTWQWIDGTCSNSNQFVCEKKYHASGEIIG